MKFPFSRRWLACGAAVLVTGYAEMAAAEALLSEFMTNNVDTLLDEDGESPDWI